MDPKAFKDMVKRLREVNEIVSQLDGAIRAEAFSVLRPYVEGDESAPPPPPPPGGRKPRAGAAKARTGDSFRDFVAQHENHDKPADNVFAIAAWWYSQYGLAPLNRATVEQMASEVGMTVPTRSDGTLNQASREGKKVFHKKGSGYAPTVSGERLLQATYSVRKGSGSPPEPEA